MFPTDLKTWTLYILPAIILGAIGSGLWEKVFRPFLSWCSRIFLLVSTFGFTTARDSIYKEIARRSLNKPVLFILFIFVGVSAGLLGAAHSNYNRSTIPEETAIKIEQEKEKEEEEETFANLSLEEKKKNLILLTAKLRESVRHLATSELLLAISILIICAYGYVRNSYISSAIAYLDQCLAICGPYISSTEKTKLLSQYASISSKNNFKELIKSLTEVANKNEVKLPLFMIL